MYAFTSYELQQEILFRNMGRFIAFRKVQNTFEFIITSNNFMFRKPNKRIFYLALGKAELQPDEVWYIGDQYECDVKGSLNAGLLPVWYIGAIDLPYAEDKNILTAKGG